MLHPSLRTGRAGLPHPALQSVGLDREGAALRLVPNCVGQSCGSNQANCTWLRPPLPSPRGHSRWSCCPSVVPSHFHLPASLGSTVVTRFPATMDALTPVGRFFGPYGHERRLSPTGLLCSRHFPSQTYCHQPPQPPHPSPPSLAMNGLDFAFP